MADLEMAREHPEKQLWDQIEDIDAGMLGFEGSTDHMQPMAPMADPAASSLWFFTSRSSDLGQKAATGGRAHFCLIGKTHDYHACLMGELKENRDETKIDEHWSPIVAAWFDQGRKDPDMTLLQFRLEHAAIWASTGNPISFGWQIAKASLTDDTPDIGVRNEIVFSAPAGH